MWQGMMRAFLLSRAMLPAGSRWSSVRHSSTAVRYKEAPGPTRDAYLPFSRKRLTLPTGNCSPTLPDLVASFDCGILLVAE
ncbi:unnamed protein product [Ectocarpus sp. 8 AP-2014]